jgi:hypothetical protein
MIADEMSRHQKLSEWHAARCLYFGGQMMKQNAELFLSRRQKEPVEVYRERIASAYYENYIGSIIDWYVSAVFRREPVIFTHGASEEAKTFLSRFLDNCDRKGTTLTEFFRTVVRDAMLFGSAHLTLDFPRLSKHPMTRAEAERMGADAAYLVNCAPEQVAAWRVDEVGTPEFVRIEVPCVKDEEQRFEPDKLRVFEYTKTSVRVQESVTDETGAASERTLAEGGHCLSHRGAVPVIRLDLPHGLWMMERAGNVQLEHFNKANALSWALSMGLFATPVVYSDREWTQIAGDSYFIQLSPEDRFGWTEPEGKVYQIAAENLERLKSEIFRVCHLGSQAGLGSTTIQQSGLSKQRDFQVTQEVLRALGDWVKKGVKRVIETALQAWGEDVLVIVAGMDQFDIGEFGAELTDAERLLAMKIGSRTLEKQIHKKLALQFLSDMRQEVKDAIVNEIENG